MNTISKNIKKKKWWLVSGLHIFNLKQIDAQIRLLSSYFALSLNFILSSVFKLAIYFLLAVQDSFFSEELLTVTWWFAEWHLLIFFWMFSVFQSRNFWNLGQLNYITILDMFWTFCQHPHLLNLLLLVKRRKAVLLEVRIYSIFLLAFSWY